MKEKVFFRDVEESFTTWHEATMPDETKEAIAGHLLEEARELVISTFVPGESRPGHSDLEEAADILLCLIGWANRGYGLPALFEAAYDKMEVNKTRTWKRTETGAYKHV